MKVCFLDVDGVLNSHVSRRLAHEKREGDWGTHRAWLPEAVEQLKRVIAETGCQLVISSDWRHAENLPDLREGFEAFSLPNWIGLTGFMGACNTVNCIRGQEIAAWIANANPEVTSFVIIDDNNWMLPVQQRNFVQTNDSFGLTRGDADLAIRILNNASHG